jgi:hypothetical protein
MKHSSVFINTLDHFFKCPKVKVTHRQAILFNSPQSG